MGICGRFKLPAVFSPSGTVTWFRMFILSQNHYTSSYSTGISIIAMTEGSVFYGNLNGNNNTEYSVLWKGLTTNTW